MECLAGAILDHTDSNRSEMSGSGAEHEAHFASRARAHYDSMASISVSNPFNSALGDGGHPAI